MATAPRVTVHLTLPEVKALLTVGDDRVQNIESAYQPEHLRSALEALRKAQSQK